MKWLLDLFSRADPPLIKEITAREAAGVARLHALSFRRGWSEDEVESMLLDRNVLGHGAWMRGRFAGFILSRMAGDEAEILSVAVDRSFQSRSIGRMLVHRHLGRLAALGVRTVFLEVEEANAPALKLYRRAGFSQVGARPGYYPRESGRPANALILRRDLT